MRANRASSAPAAAGRIAPAAQAKASPLSEASQASPGRSRLPLVPLFRLAFALLLCLSALMLLRMAAGYRSSRAAYESLRAQAAAQTVPVTETADLPSPALPRPSAPARQDGGGAVPTPAIDWQALSGINPDIAAWLYCPDTALSYPVVQGRDNRYYLDHNFSRSSDPAGALFFDCQNTLRDGPENWIVYGHRRNDGSMFGSLPAYATQAYFEAHPVMFLLLPDRSYRVELFACRTVHADQKYFPLFFLNGAALLRYAGEALSMSPWQPDAAPDGASPLLTLATCSADAGDDDPRLLLHGRLVLLNAVATGAPLP